MNKEEWKYANDIDLCFHLEKMAWFYLDFFVKEEQKKPRDENLRMIVANVFHVSVFDHSKI